MAALALGRRSKIVVTGSTEWLVRGHSLTTGAPTYVRQGHKSVVHAVACSPTHDVFASGSDNGALFLWRLTDGKWIRTFQQTGIKIWAARFTQNGRALWTAAQDGSIRGYRVRDGRQFAHIPLTTAALMSLDIFGQQLAVGANDGTVHLVDLKTRRAGQTLKGHDQISYAVRFHPTGRWLAVGNTDQKVTLWDMRTHKRVNTIALDHSVFALAWTPDGKRLAVGCGGGSIVVLGEPPKSATK